MVRLPDHLLDRLKCRFCYGTLNLAPVYVLQDGTSVCGRCSIGKIPAVRHSTYESLASGFPFPCRYRDRGCPQFFPWNNGYAHEKKCLYASYFRLLFSHPISAIKSTGKRKDYEEESKLLVVPDQVLPYLTCFSCGGYLSSAPVAVLNDGKNQCYRCLDQSSHNNQQYFRHIAFENFLSIMIFPCIYRNRGCPKKFVFGVDIQYHENNCEYAPPPKQVGRRTFVTEDGKTKGVIPTQRGHIFATITPNSLPPGEMLSLVTNNHKVKTRKVSDDVVPKYSPQTSLVESTVNGFNDENNIQKPPRQSLGLIDELKIKQKLRRAKSKENGRIIEEKLDADERYADDGKSYMASLKNVYYEYKDVIEECKAKDAYGHPVGNGVLNKNGNSRYSRNLSSPYSDSSEEIRSGVGV